MSEKRLQSKVESKVQKSKAQESTLQCVPCGNTWKQSAAKKCDQCGKAGIPVES